MLHVPAACPCNKFMLNALTMTKRKSSLKKFRHSMKIAGVKKSLADGLSCARLPQLTQMHLVEEGGGLPGLLCTFVFL
jgi:type II secretory pathway component PulK